MFKILLVSGKPFLYQWNSDDFSTLQSKNSQVRMNFCYYKTQGIGLKITISLSKKKIAKNKPPFTLGLVYRMCSDKLCAEYIFSGSLCTAWVYVIVQYLAVPAPIANSRKITSGRSVSSVILETRLQTHTLVQLYLIFKSFKHLLKFSMTFYAENYVFKFKDFK